MKLILIALVVLLTGCASNCREACVGGFGPGNSVFDSIADYHDRTDPCQMKGKPTGYQFPSFCGASKGKIVVRKMNNNTFIVTQNK
jgi:hypothetical protein